jgi:trimethylamine:corrinoid methyltransferase-like protein
VRFPKELIMTIDELLAGMDTNAIHRDALRIVEEIGLELPCAKTRERIASYSGMRVKGDRVYVSSDLAEAIVAESQKNNTVTASVCGDWRLNSGAGHCHWFLDFDGQLALFTSENVTKAIRFAKSCEKMGLNVVCSPFQADQPARMQALMQMRTCAEYYGTVYQPSVDEIAIARFCIEMLQVFGKQFHLCAHIISPLKLAGDEWSLAVEYVGQSGSDRIGPVITVSNMPAMGATAPCDYNAAWALSVAETMGAAAVLKAMGASQVELFATLYPFDLGRGNWVYGSCEHALITLMERKLRMFYGLLPRAAKSFSTGVVQPNVQAASEKTFHTTMAAMAGYREFGVAGILGIDDIWSPAQVIIDKDIFDNVKHAIGNRYSPPDMDIVAAVKDGVDKGNFLMSELTVKNHRLIYFTPRVFEKQALGQWLAEGKPNILDKAQTIARDLYDSYKLEPVLDRSKATELDTIVENARKTLVK